MESQLEMNEIERLRKSAPPHTGTVALTCVFWVICGQCKPFNSLCIGVRLTTLRTRTHTHTHSPSVAHATEATDTRQRLDS